MPYFLAYQLIAPQVQPYGQKKNPKIASTIKSKTQGTTNQTSLRLSNRKAQAAKRHGIKLEASQD